MNRILLFFTLFATFFTASASAETEITQELADRYELMLLRSPQPGKAFDGVIEWYSTKGGGLEALQKRWQTAATEDQKQQYLIVQGLLAERLMNAEAARKFYTEALSAADPVGAARLLAVLETTEGNFPAAAKAYEMALASQTLAPVDRMELMRSLALLFQRSFEDDKALAIWRDAVAKFPEDVYVLDEAGEAFLAASKYDEARATFQKLRDLSKSDPYRKIAASMRLARTAELEGKTEEAVKIYEESLDETSQGSWINREVRGRIAELFRRKNDLPGLLAYYEKRTAASPQDFQSFAAMAEVQAGLGRENEAVESLRKATQLAPENQEMRLALIRQLEQLARIEEALAEAKAMAKPADAPAEALLVLGNLQWKKFELTKKEEDRTAALETWKRIAPEKTATVAQVAQLAELLASHELIDEAMTEWRRIIQLEPGASDARQRLAEVLEKRGDSKGAKEILAALVSEDRALAENFLRLARIHQRLEYEAESKATLQRGLELFPDDFELLSFAWRQAIEAQDAVAVEELFPALWKNAPNAFFAEDSVKNYVAFLESKGAELIPQMQEKVKADPSQALPALVLFRLAISKSDEAVAKGTLAVLKSQNDPVRAARAEADFAQSFGTAAEQVAALQAVAAADPRLANDSLRTAAKVLAQAGKTDEALAMVAQLIERSPADASLYSQYSDLAVAAGKYDEAVKRLNDALRFVEDKTSVRLQLTNLLQIQGRMKDAARVLQEAFEGEERDSRRMEIFRRQIELASQSGTLDDLTADLRAKQSREEGGARYGVFLAEIALMQGDNLGAKEELTRSLGRNPDNATAVSRLMDLAERGGDQEESIRLSARLAELEPTAENRASHLVKLLDSGNENEVETQLTLVRSEILKDPAAWSQVLGAMRRAGMVAQSDALIAEISAATDDPALRGAVAEMRLDQGDYAAAAEEFWRTLEGGGLGEALTAASTTTTLPAAYRVYGMSGHYLRLQGFQQIYSEVLNALQMSAMSSRGISRSMRGFGFGGMPRMATAASTTATPAQKAQVRAVFFLSQLAKAFQQEEPFFKRMEAVMAREKTSLEMQISVFSILGHSDGVRNLIVLHADDSAADVAVDRLVMGMGLAQMEELKEPLAKIEKRLSESDPTFLFEMEISRVGEEIYAGFAGRVIMRNGKPLSPLSPEEKRKRLEELLNHPGRNRAPHTELQLASMAALTQQTELALKLLAECEQNASTDKSQLAMLQYQIQSVRTQLLGSAISSGDAAAPGMFEEFIRKATESSKNSPGPYARVFSRGGYGASSSQVLQESSELAIGDSRFPFRVYSQLFQSNPTNISDPSEKEKVRKWFQNQASKEGLDDYRVGLFYYDWAGGKREEAVKQLEEIHSKNPTPRSAALLLEAYEKSGAGAKVVGVIDLAELQSTETASVRALRKIRALRLAGKIEEAKTEAEKLAGGRIASDVRNFLAGELNQLGVPLTKFPSVNPSTSSSRNRSQSRSETIRLQVQKLIQEKKTDEAERIVLQELRKPLPNSDDHERINIRSNMVQFLKQIGQTEKLELEMQDRLSKDPSDFDAAIRLAEATSTEDNRIHLDRLSTMLQNYPDRIEGMPYMIRLLQHRGERQDTMEVLCTLLKTRPELFEKSGLNFNDLQNMATNSKSGPLLAETIAGMSEEQFNKLFFRNRLMGQMGGGANLTTLAEFSASAGKPDQAILILQRAVRDLESHGGQELPVVLRLVELQLAQGQKEAAAETMNRLIAPKSSPTMAFGMRHYPTLSSNLANLLHGHSGRGSEQQLDRLLQLTNETGTLDLMLKTLEESPVIMNGLSPSLLIRTKLNKPGVEKEWRTMLEGDSSTFQAMSLPTLGLIVKAMAEQKSSRELIPELLKKVVNPQTHGSPEYALNYLIEVLPILTKLEAKAVVQQHIRTLLTTTLSNPNSSRYLMNVESYGPGLEALIEAGLLDDAQTLLDATAAGRASGNQGRFAMIESLEARLNLARGKGGSFQVTCAGIPVSENRLKVHWAMTLKVADADPNDSGLPAWDGAGSSLPKKLRPTQIEIFAGPNPGSLEPLAQVTPKETSGNVEVKPTAPLGLLQARWKTADGSTEWGPLTVYALGENLIQRDGVPQENGSKDAVLALKNFKTGQPGPLGDTAVVYDALLPLSENHLPLAVLKRESTPNLIVFMAWTRASGPMRGNAPALELETVQANGQTNRHSPHGSGPQGLWQQVLGIWGEEATYPGFSSIEKEVESMNASIRLQAYSSHNGQYSVQGSWAGLQLVRIKAETLPDLGKLRSNFHEAIRKKEFASACDLFLANLKGDPGSALSQDANAVVEAFRQANRLPDLFSALAHPALYLQNPLRRNYQNWTKNSGLISLLAKEALSKSAPKAAEAWLQQIEKVPLGDGTRYVIDALLFQEAIARNPSEATADKFLALWGWVQPKCNEERIRGLWNTSRPGHPTLELLKSITSDKRDEILAHLKANPAPGNLQAAQKLLEALLTVSKDPAAAVELWRQSVGLRQGGQNNATIQTEADRELILQIAATDFSPGDLVASIRTWINQRYQNDENSRNQALVELLFAASGAATSKKAEFLELWADAELAALKTPGYNASRDRVRQLVDRFYDVSDWTRLEALLSLAETMPNLKSSSVREEFKGLRAKVELAKGNLDSAWPVAWSAPGTEARKVTLHWQWNLKQIDPVKGQYDTTVAVTDEPIIKTIANQQAVEWWFGEMPNDLKQIHRVEGDSATGSADVELPGQLGFLRAVAVFADRSVPGPLVPILSGTRVFPAPGGDLRSMLLSGDEPVAAGLITDAGQAPDGSQAFRIGTNKEQRNLGYAGPVLPAKAGRFYVQRCWVRRSGNGSLTSCVEFRPTKASGKQSLNMILAERSDSTGKWVLYTRAIPTFPQHTFWIPYQQVETLLPRFWDFAPGSALAGWELFEIDNWKYGEWLNELAMLRETTPPLSQEALARAVELAAIEPLTSLDYHGSWLAEQLIPGGKASALLELYRSSFQSEPNPLFSLPKMWRLFNGLHALIDSSEVSPAIKTEALTLALANRSRLNISQILGFQRRALTLALGQPNEAQAKAEIAADIKNTLSDSTAFEAFLSAAISPRNYRKDRPYSDLATIASLLGDKELFTSLNKGIEGTSSIPGPKRMFATLLFETALNGVGDQKLWDEKVARAFAATEKSEASDDFMFWPAILGDQLTQLKIDPAAILSVRTKAFERIKLQKIDPGSVKELLRAGEYLIETSLAQANKPLAVATATEMTARLKEFTGKLPDDALRMVLHSLDHLSAAGESATAAALFQTIQERAKQSTKMSEAFLKYQPVESTPTAN